MLCTGVGDYLVNVFEIFMFYYGFCEIVDCIDIKL